MRLADKVTIITGAGGGMGRVAARTVRRGGRPGRRRRVQRGGRRGDGRAGPRGRRGGHVREGRRLERGRRQARWSITRSRPTAASTPCTTTPGSCPRPTTRSSTPTSTPGTRSWPSTCAASSSAASTPSRRWRPSGGGSIINIASFVAILGCSRAAGRVHRLEGRGAGADPQPGGPVRAEGRPHQRDLPGPGRDAAADGLAGQGRGGQAAPARAQPDAAASASPRRS